MAWCRSSSTFVICSGTMADATTATPSGAFDGADWSALAIPSPVLSAVPPVIRPNGDSTLLLELSPRVRRVGQDEGIVVPLLSIEILLAMERGHR